MTLRRHQVNKILSASVNLVPAGMEDENCGNVKPSLVVEMLAPMQLKEKGQVRKATEPEDGELSRNTMVNQN
jgi:hypothetical protein